MMELCLKDGPLNYYATLPTTTKIDQTDLMKTKQKTTYRIYLTNIYPREKEKGNRNRVQAVNVCICPMSQEYPIPSTPARGDLPLNMNPTPMRQQSRKEYMIENATNARSKYRLATPAPDISIDNTLILSSRRSGTEPMSKDRPHRCLLRLPHTYLYHENS